MSDVNPCMSCGACCAYFRVSFYWAEADDAGGLVPAELTEAVTPFLRCMSGTRQKPCRCSALEGTPGEATRCTIYHQRPSPCREFMASGENGEANEACDRARAHYGLPPLYKDMPFHTPADAATEGLSRVQLR
ncbi:YkgJ family cysteine cluster protein [Metakosakonia massiliensis]|uniref:Flagellin N-methylase n=1 Tax=Phytobacter massiliensis TaxID=1485952 RepID=A0A6N3HS44_9ENTR|nr:YkgJ family cysteine cluster protein [Phytobacter massiliensis]